MKNIWEILSARYPERKPYSGEDEYFQHNKNVAGMATDDQAVITNPYSALSPQEMDAVRNNERVRLSIKGLGMTPAFDLTDEQKQSFVGTPYENNPNAKDTIIARYLSGDPSALKVTPQQEEFGRALVDIFLQSKHGFKMNDPRESDFQGFLAQQQRRVPFKYNPDDPQYDYRAAHRAGVTPQMYFDGVPHWDSRFKGENHPNRYVDGEDTKTGKRINPLGFK